MQTDTHIIDIIGTENDVKINATNLDKSRKVIQATPLFCKSVIFFISLDTRLKICIPNFEFQTRPQNILSLLLLQGKG